MYQIFVVASVNPGGRVSVLDDDVLLSHEQEIEPTTSLDGNYKKFVFQTDRNYYVDSRQTYLALKQKFVKGRGCETYFTKEFIKEHKEEAEADVEATAEEDEEAPVLPVTHVNNVLL